MSEERIGPVNPQEFQSPQPGVTDVAVFDASSPTELRAKKGDATLDTRGFQILAAKAEVSILVGGDEEIVKRRLADEFEGFRSLPLAEKRDKYKTLRVEVEKVTTRTGFMSVLNRYADIAKDSANGPMDDLVGMEVANRRKDFDKAGLPTRLLMITRLRAETQEMLIAKFPIYVSLWEDVSTQNGETPERIEEQKRTLQERFDNASERGKSGIAYGLRSQIETADLTRFQAYKEMYERLFREKGIPEEGTLDLPSPEQFSAMFNSVDLKRKRGVLNQLQSKTHLLLTPDFK